MEPFSHYSVIHWTPESSSETTVNLIGEEPLSIRIFGKPYSVVMRTPGDEIAHVAGFCLGEGIVDAPDDFGAIAFCDGEDTNVVTVTLTPERKAKIPDYLDRREYISQSSCGLCGKELIDELYQSIRPVSKNVSVDIGLAYRCLDRLGDFQTLRKKTVSAHASAIFDSAGRFLSAAEDIGRHNALDKAIGAIFLNRTLDRASVLSLSSRVSYELVQKAARAKIPIILSISRPSELAVSLAAKLDISLACLARDGGLFIFCGEHRLVR